MLEATKKRFIENSLNKAFNWFYLNFNDRVTESFRQYWNLDVETTLVSLSLDANELFSGIEYFVTRMKITKEFYVTLRLSRSIISIVLDSVLGSVKNNFTLEKMTDIESKILTDFSINMYKNISIHFKNKTIIKLMDNSNTDYNLIFMIKNKVNGKIGKIIISLPIESITPEYLESSSYPIDFDIYGKCNDYASFFIGEAKATLLDIKNLNIGDIIVLDSSDIEFMELKYKNYKKKFKLHPDQSIVIKENEDEMEEAEDYDQEYIEEEGENMTDGFGENLWDGIQIDIKAEFEDIKVPLGLLRQITEGSVVELCDIYKNKVDLKVEDRLVASGELVIVNDRYGVKVEAIHSNNANSVVVQGNLDENDGEINLETDFDEESFGTNVEEDDFNIEEEDEIEEENSSESDESLQNDEEEEFDYNEFDEEDSEEDNEEDQT